MVQNETVPNEVVVTVDSDDCAVVVDIEKRGRGRSWEIERGKNSVVIEKSMGMPFGNPPVVLSSK
jgi:hypothetical protein